MARTKAPTPKPKSPTPSPAKTSHAPKVAKRKKKPQQSFQIYIFKVCARTHNIYYR